MPLHGPIRTRSCQGMIQHKYKHMDDLLFNPLDDDITSTTMSLTPEPSSVVSDTPSESLALPSIDSPSELNPADMAKLRTSLLSLKTQIDSILDILKTNKNPSTYATNTSFLAEPAYTPSDDQQRTLEGIFDGEKMIGDDGGIYTIPPNYASKSKLVEGDRMKLTITSHGSFIYKQVKPINRKRLVGEMVLDQELNQWGVFSDGKLYKVLKASVTFYKGNVGDEAVILVAEDIPCTWGAIENIMHK